MKICPKTGSACTSSGCDPTNLIHCSKAMIWKLGTTTDIVPIGLGEISKPMNVNTKPAHRIEVDGYWILIDPSMPDEVFERFKRKLEIN